MAERSETPESTSSSTSVMSETGRAHSDEGARMEGGQDASLAGKQEASSLPDGEVASGIDSLLQRHRNEIMFELRRLQHGDRPVTGQGNKEAVEDFFNRNLTTDDTSASSSARPTTARPENVVVEVNALVQRRPVSSILQSANFRHSLENALRGAIGNLNPTRLITPQHPRPVRAQPNNAAAPLLTPPPPAPVIDFDESQAATVQRTESLRADHQGHGSSASLSSYVSTSSSSVHLPQPTNNAGQQAEPPQQGPSSVPAHNQARRLPAPPRSQQEQPWLTRPPPSTVRAQAWLQQEVPVNVNVSEQEQMSVWDSLEQSQREDLICDISELVQRQLVTSSLQGQMRNRLENHMRRRVADTGADGARVQEFIATLPRSPYHQRNDFSELGIPGPQAQQAAAEGSDHLDEMSVISATAAVTVPYAQSNAAMSHEMRSVKAQLQELKTMMRLSFDLQLDIQRSIRQEVAAAMSQALGGSQTEVTASSSASATQAAHPPRPANEGQCLICLDKMVDSVLYQCGHMCVCNSCGLQLKSQGAHCPVCRAPIRDIIRAYRST